mmetsp:Transcript_367/g.621  ORF Transcript_367/g.621 Transcript_367/m.621 type:complete len:246 (-) Transcript_367:28-765(-)
MLFIFAHGLLLHTCETEDIHRMQWVLMNRFIGSLETDSPVIFNDKFSRLSLLPTTINEVGFSTVCKWKGVHCNDRSLITAINWKNLSKKQETFFNIEWLPPTLTRINMEMILFFHSAEIRTRTFPRALIFCALTRTGLLGNINLQTLPEHLRRLDLSYNHFEGTVSLVHLPKTIERIIFRSNAIRKVVLFNERLPSTLQYAVFSQVMRKVKFVCFDGELPDPRVTQDDSIEQDSYSSSEDSEDLL